MKFLIIFALAVVAAMAAPPSPLEVAIVRNVQDISPTGYNFAFEQSDGQKRDEAGEVKNIGAENEGIAVRGSFSFVADDGQTYTVTYIADENGFQPSAAHLPVA